MDENTKLINPPESNTVDNDNLANITTVERSRVTDYNALIRMGFDKTDVARAIWCSNDIAEALDILSGWDSQIILENEHPIDHRTPQMIEENKQKVRDIQGRKMSESEMLSGIDRFSNQDSLTEDMMNSSGANSNLDKEERRRLAVQAADERQKQGEARGLKNPDAYERMIKRKEKQESEYTNSTFGNNLKWRI